MRILTFSGYTWWVKESAEPVGPGPNLFAASSRHVEVDRQGRLHLRILRIGDKWTCSEVVNTRSLGYGTYRFYLETDVALLDTNIVLGLFTWSDSPDYAHREIDIEFAQWSEPGAPNAQFVVQPTSPERMVRFRMPHGIVRSVHSFLWEPGVVRFSSRCRWNPTRGSILHTWTFAGRDVPVPGDENARMNLWLNGGKPPTDGKEVEVIISRFQFEPYQDGKKPTFAG